MTITTSKFITTIVRRVSTKPTTNVEIQPFIYNRNPRNLERMRIERKPTGYELEKKLVSYWHKLNVLKHSDYVVAQLVHNTEKVVVQASTNEWSIKRHLYSTKDRMAFIILGKVFAERCLESGIISFASPYDIKNSQKSTKISLFLNVLKDEGLALTEANVYNIHDIWYKGREKKPWTVLED